jgi:hypothetical protein
VPRCYGLGFDRFLTLGEGFVCSEVKSSEPLRWQFVHDMRCGGAEEVPALKNRCSLQTQVIVSTMHMYDAKQVVMSRLGESGATAPRPNQNQRSGKCRRAARQSSASETSRSPLFQLSATTAPTPQQCRPTNLPEEAPALPSQDNSRRQCLPPPMLPTCRTLASGPKALPPRQDQTRSARA